MTTAAEPIIKYTTVPNPTGGPALLKEIAKRDTGGNDPGLGPNPIDELRDLEAVEKSTHAFMKHAESHVQRAWSLVKSAHEISGIKSFVEFCETEQGMDLCNLYNDARALYLEGPGSAIAKAADPVKAKIASEIASAVEDMSLAHNLDEHTARKRLREISPSFRELEAREIEVDKVSRAAIEKSKALVQVWHLASQKQAETAVKAAAAKRDEAEALARKRALMVPSEAQLFEKAEKLAAEKHIEVSAALLQLTTTDPEGIRLNTAAKRERELRMAGVR